MSSQDEHKFKMGGAGAPLQTERTSSWLVRVLVVVAEAAVKGFFGGVLFMWVLLFLREGNAFYYFRHMLDILLGRSTYSAAFYAVWALASVVLLGRGLLALGKPSPRKERSD